MNCFRGRSQSSERKKNVKRVEKAKTSSQRKLRSTVKKKNNDEDILIPFLKISGKIEDSTSIQTSDGSLSKLIDGYPRSISTSSPDIRIRKSYVMSYNNETKNAEWVYEILNKANTEINCKEKMSFGKNKLKGNDNDQGKKKSKGKGFDQGHLAAAANHRWCQEAYHDTFLISNMVPQDKSLNRRDWKSIEKHCRRKAKSPDVCNLHVYTGPLYLKKEKEKVEDEDEYDRVDPSDMKWLGGKAVPTHFFKVIIAEKEDGTVEEPKCYVMPELVEDDYIDPKEPLYKYTQCIEIIQKLSGLNFIESHPKVVKDCIKTITWKGEGKTGKSCSAVIKVRISSV